MSTELWLPVVGFASSYSVSTHGRVKSLARVVLRGDGKRLPVPERLLRPRVGNGGYLNVVLKVGGKQYGRLVHRLVLEAHVGPCPEGMQGCHGDGDPRNNVVENLRWDTAAGNNADKAGHGTAPQGERNPNAKLTPGAVLLLRGLYATGTWTQAALAERFGVSRSNVADVLRGRTWRPLMR